MSPTPGRPSCPRRRPRRRAARAAHRRPPGPRGRSRRAAARRRVGDRGPSGLLRNGRRAGRLLAAVTDRSSIDVALARRLIDRQFPQWSALPIAEVEVDGWDNRTFRLGSELPSACRAGTGTPQQVDKEQRWLPVLAPQLPLPIPTPVAQGAPDAGFPYPWSVYRWLDGELASRARIDDLTAFATTPRRVPERAGPRRRDRRPAAREHNFFRGGPLATYEQEALEAIDALGDEVPRDAVLRAWDDAMSTTWDRDPVWLHGDVAVGNLLVRDGRLAAVLDFGSSGVGDPACDLVIAWTFLPGASRRPVPRRARRRRRHVVARARLGAVEGADHAGRAPRARLARRGRSATRHRAGPRRPRARRLTDRYSPRSRCSRRRSRPGRRGCVSSHSSRAGSRPARRAATTHAVWACRRRLASPSGITSACSLSAGRCLPQNGQR